MDNMNPCASFKGLPLRAPPRTLDSRCTHRRTSIYRQPPLSNQPSKVNQPSLQLEATQEISSDNPHFCSGLSPFTSPTPSLKWRCLQYLSRLSKPKTTHVAENRCLRGRLIDSVLNTSSAFLNRHAPIPIRGMADAFSSSH